MTNKFPVIIRNELKPYQPVRLLEDYEGCMLPKIVDRSYIICTL